VTTDVGLPATSTTSWASSDRASSDRASSDGATVTVATVTVVVCAYTLRRWPEITRAVGSVLAQRTAPQEVILVVDHNEELLDRAVAAFPEVTVVPNSGPRGLSAARNTGVAHAHAQVVAFLDDDAQARPDWLTRLARHYQDPDVLGVGGPAVPAWEGTRPRWLPPEFDWVVGCSFTGQPSRVAPVRNLIGCNMSFRRDALRQAGGFDSALGRVGTVPVGCEETELCIRLRRRRPGGVILYDPQAGVSHRVTAERTTWRYFRRRCLSEGRSKAVVAHLAGTEAGLSAERDYARRTLPHGVRRELSTSHTGDHGGLLRAGVIVAGLAVTTTGYLFARARGVCDVRGGCDVRGARGSPARSGAEPTRVLTVELCDGVPAVPDTPRPEGGRYGAARVLVRLHGQPLGLLHHDLPPGGLTAQAHAELIARSLSAQIEEQQIEEQQIEEQQIEEHLRESRVPSTRSPFVSVVVPTCGREPLLRRCLDALGALDYPRYEIVVVDNTPLACPPTSPEATQRSGTAELVARYANDMSGNGAPVRYVTQPRRGVGHARNRGLAEARGEIVAFADDDVIVDRGWLRALVDGFTDTDVVAVTGFVLAQELETPAQVWVERYGGFGKGCLRRRFDATGYQTLEHGQVRRSDAGPHSLYPYLPGTYGSGANMAFRTATLRRLGGFDPVLGSRTAVPTGEDIDVLMRVVLAGHTLAYEPSAIVWHAHKRELPALRRTMFDYGVGLGAVLAKCLVTDRAGRRELVRRLPRGIGYALWPGSAKNAGKRGGYPASLTALEMCGMALGPAYYAKARWTTRSGRARSGRA
jgi:cellulose synthase/poly-beta-1,6-N-acetylglucosamine synthase-like glycosyltransferase